jgi:hypothetical protein
LLVVEEVVLDHLLLVAEEVAEVLVDIEQIIMYIIVLAPIQ